MCGLKELFKRYKGQPVEILTSDGVRYCGTDLDSDEDSVEIIDECGRIVFIPFSHIDAVIQPTMRLRKFCKQYDCDCDRSNENKDYDCEYDC